MRTLIVYATKYGFTKSCVEKLAKKLNGKVDIYNLKDAAPDLSQYDRVIIGGSVYIGGIRKEVKEFCTNNINALKDKKLGLFICGMQTDDVIKTELNTAFPEELSVNAAAKEYFGGEFIMKKMGFMDRFIVKKITKNDKDVSNVKEENISRFALAMNNE